jgi:hypothetical protein
VQTRVKIAVGGLLALVVARLAGGEGATPQPSAASSGRAPLGQAPSADGLKAACPASSLPDHGVCIPVPAGDSDDGGAAAVGR